MTPTIPHMRADFGQLQLVAAGTIPTTGVEQAIYEIQGGTPVEMWAMLDLTNMQAGDTLRVREYSYIGAGWKMHSDSAGTITGVAALPALQIGPTTSLGYRLTIQRTGGVDRDYAYEVYRGVR